MKNENNKLRKANEKLTADSADTTKAEEVSTELIGTVLNGVLGREYQKLLATEEGDLRKHYWFFKYEKDNSPSWNLYQFSQCFEHYRLRMRRWEEYHNGTRCVVERVRDQYLMPEVNEFVTNITQPKVGERPMADETLGSAIENAASDLPKQYRIEISVESGSATVTMYDSDDGTHCDFSAETLAGEVTEATKLAIHDDAKPKPKRG